MNGNYIEVTKNPQLDKKVIDLTHAMETKRQKFLLRKYKDYGRKKSQVLSKIC
jgi:uncharacterized membrane protein YgcG